MGVDYAKLIEPYSEATPPANTATKRTPEGQKVWLLKRGIPEGIADDAMTAVYTELAAGRVFEAKDGNPAGYWLDRHLLETARELQRKSGTRPWLPSDDLATVAEFSRLSIKVAFWKGAAIGAAVTFSAAVGIWLLIL